MQKNIKLLLLVSVFAGTALAEDTGKMVEESMKRRAKEFVLPFASTVRDFFNGQRWAEFGDEYDRHYPGTVEPESDVQQEFAGDAVETDQLATGVQEKVDPVIEPEREFVIEPERVPEREFVVGRGFQPDVPEKPVLPPVVSVSRDSTLVPPVAKDLPSLTKVEGFKLFCSDHKYKLMATAAIVATCCVAAYLYYKKKKATEEELEEEAEAAIE